MKRLLKLMGVTTGICCLVWAGCSMLFAQTAPAGSSVTISSNNNCPTPAPGIFSFCKPTAGGVVQWTDEGSAYAKVNFSGTPGPQGPQGVPGPAGPTGAQGPAGTIPTTFTCDIAIAVGGKATLSNCK